jgi:hypothetical protein
MTAAVAVGSVGAMSQAHEEASAEDLGAAFGAIARYRGEVSAAESVAAADPGDVSAASLPPRLGGAGVS